MLEPAGPDRPFFVAVEVHVEFEVAEDRGQELVHFCCGYVFSDTDLNKNRVRVRMVERTAGLTLGP
jgi:hypothetical protein